MRKHLERYGISGNEVYNLSKRWQRIVRDDSVWESFDAFVFWCSVSGYGPGKNLRKRWEDEPHGPGNSYWYSRAEEAKLRHEKAVSDQNIKSHFCNGCKQKCPIGAGGCAAYKEWWIKNWNKNIYRKPKPPKTEAKQFFRYEHPDLIREGLIFGR